MLLPASYQSGFAPRDNRPLYPSLWNGCVGAWAPCLGPSGLVLRDWSGLQNNGVLTNGPTWGPSQGKYAITFDGTDDYVDCGALSNVDGLTQYTLAVWGRKTAVNKTIPVGKRNVAAYCGIDVWSDGYVYFQISPGYGLYSLDDTNWHHYVMVFDGSQSGNANRVKGYVDGLNVSLSFAGTIPATTPAAGNFYIGQDTQGTTGRYGTCAIDEVRVYNRVLAPQEIRLLASRRGIAYEMAPRRRSGVSGGFSAAWARRRALVIGGGMQ